MEYARATKLFEQVSKNHIQISKNANTHNTWSGVNIELLGVT